MLILAAVAPAIFLLLAFYIIDRRSPEPLGLLILLYILGMVSVLPILVVETLLDFVNIFKYFDTDLMNAYDALVVAGFTEELFKWLIVMFVAYKRSAFDEHLDGIIYCVFVSLGFATVENVLYVLEGSYNVALTRALLTVPAHMLFGVTMGYYISYSRFSIDFNQKIGSIIVSLVLPILIHGIYDYILMSRYKILLLFFIPFIIWMWIFNLKKLLHSYKLSSQELENR